MLCLHGNAGNLDGMSNMARTMIGQGYDVYLLEYAGYGICHTHQPSTDRLVKDLQDGIMHYAWVFDGWGSDMRVFASQR